MKLAKYKRENRGQFIVALFQLRYHTVYLYSFYQ